MAASKAWVVITAPNVFAGWDGTNWADDQFNPTTDPTVGRTPVKGCVVLSAHTDSAAGEVEFAISVYDGTQWTDPWTSAKHGKIYQHVTKDRLQPDGTVYGWVNEAGAGGIARAASMDSCNIIFWAEADGFHSLFENGEGELVEESYPFPAGVTLADLPATGYVSTPIPAPTPVTPPVGATGATGATGGSTGATAPAKATATPAGFDGSITGGWYLANIISHRGR